jgi:SUMO ligase MMS21 Smc5/6 complex component
MTIRLFSGPFLIYGAEVSNNCKITLNKYIIGFTCGKKSNLIPGRYYIKSKFLCK